MSNLSSGCSSSDNQFLFVNGRHIDHPKVSKIVNTLYRARRKDRYPMFVLFVTTHPSRINVCITPDKRTIVMRDEHVLLAMLHEAVIKAFELENSTFVPLSTKSQDAVPFRVNSASQKVPEKDLKSEKENDILVPARKRPANSPIFTNDEADEDNEQSKSSKRSVPPAHRVYRKASTEPNMFRGLHTIPDAGTNGEDAGVTVRADDYGFYIDDGAAGPVEEEVFQLPPSQNGVNIEQSSTPVDSNNSADNPTSNPVNEYDAGEWDGPISRYDTHTSPEAPPIISRLNTYEITQGIQQQPASVTNMDGVAEYETPVNQDQIPVVTIDNAVDDQYSLCEGNTVTQGVTQSTDIEILNNSEIETMGEPFYYSGPLVSHTAIGLPEFKFQIPVETKLMSLPYIVPKPKFESQTLEVDASNEDYHQWREADTKFFTDFYNNVNVLEPNAPFTKNTALKISKMLSEDKHDENIAPNDVEEVASEFETKLSLK